ncbi:MAG: hypothetical protein K6G83_07700 [Lachnospiraceae bacterium]|nr:hypothetical protein [Lachnospiraceae bacterium]
MIRSENDRIGMNRFMPKRTIRMRIGAVRKYAYLGKNLSKQSYDKGYDRDR